jgi:hypothetical protein
MTWAVVGLVAILAGVVGLATITYWYGLDMGWTGSGSVLVVPRSPIAAGALMSVAAVLVGGATALIGPGVPVRSLRGAWLLAATVLVAGSVPVALAAYPQVEPAELVAHGEGRWKTTVPVTEIFGIRELTTATVTIEGRADRRVCRSEWRSVTIDRSTGAIVEVVRLPTSYADEAQIPPDPAPVDPDLFEVVQGSAPFICQD